MTYEFIPLSRIRREHDKVFVLMENRHRSHAYDHDGIYRGEDRKIPDRSNWARRYCARLQRELHPVERFFDLIRRFAR